MGKEHAETRSKALPSQIPVIAPRPSQSSLPSSLSTPQLGLVPPTRHLAVSGTPAPTSGQNAPAAGAAGGLTSFRSFRNLLSFGPSKSHASIPVPVSSGVMRPFVGLRRSTQAERSPRMSTSQPPDEQAQDDLPVLSIEMAAILLALGMPRVSAAPLWIETHIIRESVVPTSGVSLRGPCSLQILYQ